MEKDRTSPRATRKSVTGAGMEPANGRKTRAAGTAAKTAAAGTESGTKAKVPRKRTVRATKPAGAALTSAERLEMIRQAAYYRAERRGFATGHEAEDWLAAEAEIDAGLAAIAKRPSRRSAGKRAN